MMDLYSRSFNNCPKWILTIKDLDGLLYLLNFALELNFLDSFLFYDL